MREPPLLMLRCPSQQSKRDVVGREHGKRVKRGRIGVSFSERSKMPNSMVCGIDIGDNAGLASILIHLLIQQ